jgi:cytochrome c oxidase subunit II
VYNPAVLDPLAAETALLRFAPIALTAAMLGVAIWGCAIPAPPGEARGRALFKTCQPCHGPMGQGNLALRAPAIGGLPEWYINNELNKFQQNIRGAHPDDNEGHRMRPMARTLYHPHDLEAVSSYVSKLPLAKVEASVTGDVMAGQLKYGTICVACHGPQAQGQQVMNAPPLAQQADWYLLAQLEKFKTGMRGANPKDFTGAQMRAMSSTLQDTTAMRNVVAYIKTLSH